LWIGLPAALQKFDEGFLENFFDMRGLIEAGLTELPADRTDRRLAQPFQLLRGDEGEECFWGLGLGINASGPAHGRSLRRSGSGEH
jgi:hypothetical protein